LFLAQVGFRPACELSGQGCTKQVICFFWSFSSLTVPRFSSGAGRVSPQARLDFPAAAGFSLWILDPRVGRFLLCAPIDCLNCMISASISFVAGARARRRFPFPARVPGAPVRSCFSYASPLRCLPGHPNPSLATTVFLRVRFSIGLGPRSPFQSCCAARIHSRSDFSFSAAGFCLVFPSVAAAFLFACSRFSFDCVRISVDISRCSRSLR
jgi:hypothetical protein